MSKYYKLVTVNNLKALQEKLLSLLPDIYKEHKNFITLNDHLSSIEIPELREAMDQFGLTQYADQFFSYNIMPANCRGPIHIDSEHFRYTLNIPLTDCSNTYVNFYKVDPDKRGAWIVEPNDRENTVISFYSYRTSGCVEVERAYINQPYILDTTVPHNIVCEDISTPRIMFLARVNRDADEHVQKITRLTDNDIYISK